MLGPRNIGIVASPTRIEVKPSRMKLKCSILMPLPWSYWLTKCRTSTITTTPYLLFFLGTETYKEKKHVLNLDILTQFILCFPSCRCASATWLAPMPGPKDLPERKVQRCATKVTGPFPTCEGNDMVVGQGNNFLWIYINEQTQRNTTLKDSSSVLNVHLKSSQNHILD